MTVIESNARFILLAVLAEIEVFAELPDETLELPNPFVAAMCRDGVPFTPALWTGKVLPPARRMAFSRAAHRLAQGGDVIRITERLRDRVRCLVPTPAGLARALALANGKADHLAVREGLLRTRWGHDMAKRLGRTA